MLVQPILERLSVESGVVFLLAAFGLLVCFLLFAFGTWNPHQLTPVPLY